MFKDIITVKIMITLYFGLPPKPIWYLYLYQFIEHTTTETTFLKYIIIILFLCLKTSKGFNHSKFLITVRKLLISTSILFPLNSSSLSPIWTHLLCQTNLLITNRCHSNQSVVIVGMPTDVVIKGNVQSISIPSIAWKVQCS